MTEVSGLLARLEEHEGFRAHAYQDSLGIWTIGFGRCVDKRKCRGLTKPEARYLLLNDVQRCWDELDRKLPWWRDLDSVRRDVLTEMCFQLGITGLLRFHLTLQAVKERCWEEASKGMLASHWARRQTPARARRLAGMMRTGREVPLEA